MVFVLKIRMVFIVEEVVYSCLDMPDELIGFKIIFHGDFVSVGDWVSLLK